MDDLISRQAVITLPVTSKEHREYQTYNLDDAYEQGWFDLQKCIEELPSAQPEIIRCKDCRYWQPQEEWVVEVPICTRTERDHDYLMLIDGDGFCSYAERREMPE